MIKFRSLNLRSFLSKDSEPCERRGKNLTGVLWHASSGQAMPEHTVAMVTCKKKKNQAMISQCVISQGYLEEQNL